MAEFERLLTKTAGALNRLEIEYLITGEAAVVYWGRPRFTADIDIAIELKEPDIKPLARELRGGLGEDVYIDEDMIRAEYERMGEFNVIIPGSGLKIDFFVVRDDPFEKKRFGRTIIKKIGKEVVRFISPEDLILTKLVWHKKSGSQKQLEDVQSVIAIQGKKLDTKYLIEWAERQGTADILNKLLSRQ